VPASPEPVCFYNTVDAVDFTASGLKLVILPVEAMSSNSEDDLQGLPLLY
jgi:hypothetical protein